jgi:hypothetical protein
LVTKYDSAITNINLQNILKVMQFKIAHCNRAKKKEGGEGLERDERRNDTGAG